VTALLYAVNLWFTHPDLGNDDCLTGDHFATEWAALAAAGRVEVHFATVPDQRHCAFIEILGPDGMRAVIQRPDVAALARRDLALAAADRAADRSEAVMQAGMMGGVDAYNDACEAWDG